MQLPHHSSQLFHFRPRHHVLAPSLRRECSIRARYTGLPGNGTFFTFPASIALPGNIARRPWNPIRHQPFHTLLTSVCQSSQHGPRFRIGRDNHLRANRIEPFIRPLLSPGEKASSKSHPLTFPLCAPLPWASPDQSPVRPPLPLCNCAPAQWHSPSLRPNLHSGRTYPCRGLHPPFQGKHLHFCHARATLRAPTPSVRKHRSQSRHCRHGHRRLPLPVLNNDRPSCRLLSFARHSPRQIEGCFALPFTPCADRVRPSGRTSGHASQRHGPVSASPVPHPSRDGPHAPSAIANGGNLDPFDTHSSLRHQFTCTLPLMSGSGNSGLASPDAGRPRPF